MTLTTDQIVEQRILEHEARLKHLDEMLERVDRGTEELEQPVEIREELKELHATRDDLARHLAQIRKMNQQAEAQLILEKMGPMAIWETVAQKLEGLVERIEH